MLVQHFYSSNFTVLLWLSINKLVPDPIDWDKDKHGCWLFQADGVPVEAESGKEGREDANQDQEDGLGGQAAGGGEDRDRER